MANYTIRPINTGYIGGAPGKNEPANFYNYHFSMFKLLEEKGMPPAHRNACIMFLIEGNGKKILCDTGMWDTERADKYHHKGSVQDKGYAIHERLAALDIKPEDIDYIIYTHLHWDHVAYSNLFTNAIKFCNKTELEFALDPIPLYYKSYESPVLGINSGLKELKFETLMGETEILPGIRVFDSPGHSPGHISVEVDTENGTYILAGDSAFGLYSFDSVPELHYNITPPGRFVDIVDYWRTLEKTKERAEKLDHILLTHEPTLLELMKKEPIIGIKR